MWLFPRMTKVTCPHSNNFMNLDYIYGEPIIYKGIKIYPYKMKDYEYFDRSTEILLFDKNQISNIEIIQMSYLKFLLTVVPFNEKYSDVNERLSELFKFTFKDNHVYLSEEDGKIIINFTEKIEVKLEKIKEKAKTYKHSDMLLKLIDSLKECDLKCTRTFYNILTSAMLDNLRLWDSNSTEYKELCDFMDMATVIFNDKTVKLRERDFDNIKDIILKQNAIEIDNDDMHPDLKKKVHEAMKLLARRSGIQEGTIEEQIISYKVMMKFESYEPIKNMTIYQFRKELQRLDLAIDYKIYKTAEMSGMVEFKKPIPHWRSHIDSKIDYSSVLMDRKQFDSISNNMFGKS